VHRYSGLPDLSLGSQASRELERGHVIYALQLAIEHLITLDELERWAGGVTNESIQFASMDVHQIIWEVADDSIRGRDLDHQLVQMYLDELIQGEPGDLAAR